MTELKIENGKIKNIKKKKTYTFSYGLIFVKCFSVQTMKMDFEFVCVNIQKTR